MAEPRRPEVILASLTTPPHRAIDDEPSPTLIRRIEAVKTSKSVAYVTNLEKRKEELLDTLQAVYDVLSEDWENYSKDSLRGVLLEQIENALL